MSIQLASREIPQIEVRYTDLFEQEGTEKTESFDLTLFPPFAPVQSITENRLVGK